jgi:hypothetical protein
MAKKEVEMASDFRTLLAEDRQAALRLLFDYWVEELLNMPEGEVEVAKTLATWACATDGSPRLVLGDDDQITRLFCDRFRSACGE